MKEIDDEEFVQRLIDSGWDEAEAREELKRALENAAEEDGME